MNKLTETVGGKYVPKVGLMVYEWGSQYYMEAHEVGADGRMEAGVPVTEELVGDMVAFFATKEATGAKIKGVMPECVLGCEWGVERKLLVWYDVPMKRMMHFTKDLGIDSGMAWQPGLVYVWMDGGLEIYAVVCDGRPRMDAVLYRAPYHNVNGNGDVCLGSARVAKPDKWTYEGVMRYVEHLFWGSAFSHLAANNSPVRGNLNLYWAEQITVVDRGFDNGILLPVNGKLTLGKLLNNLFK